MSVVNPQSTDNKGKVEGSNPSFSAISKTLYLLENPSIYRVF
jgi:hypothetical protein